jgi:hypothetical protein
MRRPAALGRSPPPDAVAAAAAAAAANAASYRKHKSRNNHPGRETRTRAGSMPIERSYRPRAAESLSVRYASSINLIPRRVSTSEMDRSRAYAEHVIHQRVKHRFVGKVETVLASNVVRMPLQHQPLRKSVGNHQQPRHDARTWYARRI